MGNVGQEVLVVPKPSNPARRVCTKSYNYIYGNCSI